MSCPECERAVLRVYAAARRLRLSWLLNRLLGPAAMVAVATLVTVVVVHASTGGCDLVPWERVWSISALLCCQPEQQIGAAGLTTTGILVLLSTPAVVRELILIWSPNTLCSRIGLFLHIVAVSACILVAFVGVIFVGMIPTCSRGHRLHDVGSVITFGIGVLLVFVYNLPILGSRSARQALGGVPATLIRIAICMLAIAGLAVASSAGWGSSHSASEWIVGECLIASAVVVQLGLAQADCLQHERAATISAASAAAEKEPFLGRRSAQHQA